MADSSPLDIFDLRRTHFVLWAPGTAQSPSLVIARYSPDLPERVEASTTHAFHKEQEGFWLLNAESLGLHDGVYHYWFLINDTSPKRFSAMLVTDPFAYSVDYKITKYPGDDTRNAQWRQPASLIMLRAGELLPCDPSGIEFTAGQIPSLRSLPLNTQLVIYELPTSWSRAGQDPGDAQERDVGSFLDVRALLDEEVGGGNFRNVAEVRLGAHLLELGINALELLPPADAKARREWGYATANYFAPDYDLGLPVQYQVSRALEDLGALVSTCHKNGIRFITDDVMAFGHDPYIHIAYQQFHIIPNDEPANPDSYQSSRNNEKRDSWGGESWRYINPTTTWGPLTGTARGLCPAWEFHRLQLKRWMSDFHVDGLRLDSVNNIGNWDFIRRFTSDAHEHFRSRYSNHSTGETPDDRFLVIAEELAVPLDMIRSGTVDALWNETFQGLLRAAILGESLDAKTNFEWTVRKMIDCRHLGFTSSTQAVNYITSHDVAGYRKERLYDFLERNGIYEKQQRAKLAFVCLLTAVGIPMIFAGEEFCDQMDRHDLEKNMGQEKQIDPVNFGRRDEPWRRDVFDHNRKLIALRKRSEALGVVDTEFIHVDFSSGRRILGWVRGNTRTHDVVVVVANFSGQDTTSGHYVFNNWPRTPEGKGWREVTSSRDVTADLVDREPLGPWQAKVYEMY